MNLRLFWRAEILRKLVPVPLLDAMALHIEALIEAVMKE